MTADNARAIGRALLAFLVLLAILASCNEA